MQSHIKLVAVLNIIYHSLFVLLGLFVFVIFFGIGVLAQDATAIGVMGIIGTIVLALLSFISLPGLIGGIGLLNGRNWARIVLLVVSAFHLLDFPIGTALSGYTYWVLLNDKSRELLEEADY